MTRLSPLFLALPLLASGCYGSSESFAEKGAKLACEQQQECNKSSFESAFSSMQDCIDTRSENTVDAFSSCEYDPRQGRECIKVTKQYQSECTPNLSELEEIARACDDVYICSNGLGLGFDPHTGQYYISSMELDE